MTLELFEEEHVDGCWCAYRESNRGILSMRETFEGVGTGWRRYRSDDLRGGVYPGQTRRLMRYDALLWSLVEGHPHDQGIEPLSPCPDSVLAAADRLAQELETTTNDAIVRLAEEGASSRERRERIAALAASVVPQSSVGA